MILPTIHTNGTSKDELIRQLCDAGSALMNAAEKLSLASPNGRDYYPQGPDALRKAEDEHFARILKVRTVYKEVQDLIEAIDAIPDWRKPR